MKEFDFLPEWYKSGRRRQISYRTQYFALAAFFVAMVVWSFLTGHSASKAQAEIEHLRGKQIHEQKVSEEFSRIKNQMTRLQQKAKSIEEIDSKIRVAEVLAELGFLINKRIVLSKVDFKAEDFGDLIKANANASAPRPATFGSKQSLSLDNVRFKVVISGVAADAGEVAELVCQLEDSPYFQQVYPSYSRNKKLKATAGPKKQDLQMTEFEISCYLANYRQQKGFAKQSPDETLER
ncbi:MAG: PilN domain-containing protein [Planctomycetota bacterium]|jgi:Tfp pilus assembly protein PilN